MAERRDILWRFLGDAKSLNRTSKSAAKGLGGVQSGMAMAAKAAGALGLALGAREIVDFAGDAMQMAIAADEIDSRFDAVFGTVTDLDDALEEWGNTAGVTTTAAKDLASSFGNLAQTQGITGQEAEDFAEKAATLAGDLASFQDLDPERVFLALNKGLLTTEKEGLKAFGLAITATEVDQRAMTIAVADGRTEITKADKAYASYEIAVEQAGKANGDLERTQDSLANKQRQLKASLKEMQEAFGRELVDALSRATSSIDTTEVHLEDLGTTAGRLVAGAIDPLISSIGDIQVATDSANPVMERLAAAWRAGYSEATGYVPPLALLDRTLNTLRGTAERMTGGATRMREEFNLFPYLELQAGLNGIGTAAGGAAGKVLTLVERMARLNQLNLVSDEISDKVKQRYSHSGGVVPGRPGTNQMAVLQAGERVVPKGDGSGGEGITINIGVAGDPQATAQVIADLLRRYEQSNGTRSSGVA